MFDYMLLEQIFKQSPVMNHGPPQILSRRLAARIPEGDFVALR
jgi:hypothetical protein